MLTSPGTEAFPSSCVLGFMPLLVYLKAKKPREAQKEKKKKHKKVTKHTVDLSLLMPVKAAASCEVARSFFFT